MSLFVSLFLPLSVLAQSETDTSNSFNITDPSQASDPIAKLELRIFDHTYKADSQEARIKRLENFVFGAAQTGDTQSRLNKLQELVTASNTLSSSTAAQGSNDSDKGTETHVAAKPTFDEADYPRVDQLERQILGQQHSHEILSGRLSRLEVKAFGQQSASTDPADRVDALDAYVARHDIYGGQGNVNVGQTVPFTPNSAAYAPSTQAAQSYPAASSASYQGTPYHSPYGTGASSPYSQAAAPSSPNPYLQSNITSTNDRLAAMEKTEFGRDYATHSLKDRVQRLEKKVDPDKKGHEGQSLPARVDQLWAVVSVSNSIGNAPVASRAGKASDYYSFSNQQANNSNNNSNKPHHSLLHSVGKVLGAAAVTAGSAGMMMGGMGMGGYGMGMSRYGMGGMGGYGMGGYGMSGYGMGGYGLSPYSMGGYNTGFGSGYSNYGGYGTGYGGYNSSYGLGHY